MSSGETPTFREIVEAVETITGIDLDDIVSTLYEDTALAQIAYVKRQKEDRAAKEASDYSNVDEALNKLGVNGNRFHEDAFNQALAGLKKAEEAVFEKPSEPVTEAEYLSNDEVKPAGDLWEIVLRGEWGSEQFRADHVEFGNGYGDSDGTLTAYIDDSVVFHAPAGTYLYARKLAE